MRSIEELKDIKGKVVFLRADLNLPVVNGKAQDDFRIKKVLPTILFLQKKGAKIILASHLSKGEGGMAPVREALRKFIKVKFVPEILGDKIKTAISEMKEGEVILLENLRNDPREKENNEIFATELSKLAEIYVNESFPVDHREDASIVLLPKLLPAYAGLQLQEEIKNLSGAFQNPERPFLFILGGAKFSTKLPLIEKYLELADNVFIGGALSNDVLKARGYEVGQSLVDDSGYDLTKLLENKKLIVPEDIVIQVGDRLVNKKVSEVKSDEIILDIGDETIKKLEPYIKNAKLILWNGPLGKYEVGGEKGTKKILKLVSDSGAKSIIGGGDTVALISAMQIEKDFSFISTGGGATLEFLVSGTLPGIKALG
ncbi:MAG: phosphoglycerate kinase [Candidatus Paceibacterota bacterium]|jgi:phosphoglycerate kinase